MGAVQGRPAETLNRSVGGSSRGHPGGLGREATTFCLGLVVVVVASVLVQSEFPRATAVLASALWPLSTKSRLLVLFLQTSGSGCLLLCNTLSQNTQSSRQPCRLVQPFVGEELRKDLARHRL